MAIVFKGELGELGHIKLPSTRENGDKYMRRNVILFDFDRNTRELIIKPKWFEFEKGLNNEQNERLMKMYTEALLNYLYEKQKDGLIEIQ